MGGPESHGGPEETMRIGPSPPSTGSQTPRVRKTKQTNLAEIRPISGRLLSPIRPLTQRPVRLQLSL